MTCRVLVVEDEIFVAMEIENVLIELGHEPVGIAPDSRKALELAPKADMALVDLNLIDGPTGLDVGRNLARQGVTVLFMTANPAQVGEGIPGALGVIAKPVMDWELRQALAFAAAVHEENDNVPPPERLTLFQGRARRRAST